MAPVMQDQELVQVRKQRRYRPGDILAVRLANGQLVSHRLIGVYPRKRRTIVDWTEKIESYQREDKQTYFTILNIDRSGSADAVNVTAVTKNCPAIVSGTLPGMLCYKQEL